MFGSCLLLIRKIKCYGKFKRNTFLLSTGKQIKLFGSSMAIGKSLEIGEGYAPNIYSCGTDAAGEKSAPAIFNPHKLTSEEIMEMADYNIRLWMELKDNIRKHGATNPKIFYGDAGK